LPGEFKELLNAHPRVQCPLLDWMLSQERRQSIESPATGVAQVFRSLHLVKTGQPECTGIGKIIMGLAQHAESHGYEVAALFLADGPLKAKMTSNGIPAHSIPWNGTIRDAKGALLVWLWLLRNPAEVIHLHWGGRLVRAICRLSGAKVVIEHVHGRINEQTGEVLTALKFPWVDAVIACSQTLADCVQGDNVEVIFSGIDTECDPREPNSQNGQLTIGILSRLIPVKNIEAAIEATALLAERGEDIRLEIAGTGPSEPHLRESVTRYGLNGRVTFLGWREDVMPLLAAWDLLALPSLDEGFPISALQAMAAARPVVASGVGGIHELVVDNVTGRIIPAPNAQALACCISELAGNRTMLGQMGKAGWQRAREHFSVAQMARRTFELYDRLLQVQER
jgi:glycosyltransferase involved in cell wall biosynthesis